MHNDRIFHLHTGAFHQGRYVLYWMQQNQRIHFNHALEHAKQIANLAQLPLVVVLVIFDQYIDANVRHYHFMFEGFSELKNGLEKQGITFVLKKGTAISGLNSLLMDAAALIMDAGYLREQRMMRKEVLDLVKKIRPDILVDLIDDHAIVPPKSVSGKAEYGAYTLRPKLTKLIQEHLDFSIEISIHQKMILPLVSDIDVKDVFSLLKKDTSIQPSLIFHGGESEAQIQLTDFISHKADHYEDSNDPGLNLTSYLSMYLHFGMISPIDIYLSLEAAVKKGTIRPSAFAAFIEQLIIRRELAINYVMFHPGYDRFETMTESWAYLTMREHDQDARPVLYDLASLEAGVTADVYFNAAMREMVLTGYMHNYMRMYWAKKIIEWTPSHQEAYRIILFLNNKYFLDGRDPNSYTGIAWCFGKHDRPWTERNVFGKLRYMNQAGLLRKFKMDAYLKRIAELERLNETSKNS